MNNSSSDSTRGLSLLLSTLMVLSMVAAGAAALGGTAVAQQSDPITVYDGSDNQTGTYGSIDAAVDNASEGYRIVLAAGEYDLTSKLDTPGLTIEGPNAGVPGTSDQRDPEANVTFGGDITADNVTIDGVHFDSDSGKLRTSGAHTTFVNTVVDVPSSDAPIWLEVGSDDTVIANNEFDGSGGGFVIHTRQDGTKLIDGVEITNNEFRNADDGVVQAKGLTNAQISSNIFTDIAADAIRLAGNVTGTSVTDNEIKNTGTNPDNALTTGIFLNAVEGEVVISGNEFANNPYHIAMYGGSAAPTIENNQFDRRVDVDNASLGDGYIAGELQAAIDYAADGSTVSASAGTYDESVTIDTANITLAGPNAGIPADVDRGSEAVIQGTVSIAATNVTVDGFTVRAGSGDLVSLGGAEYTVANNVLNATSGAVGAYGSADAGTLANNTIVTGGTSNYGVRIGDATGVTVADNTFVQEAVPEASDNTPQGLLLSSTHDTQVRNNTFLGTESGQAVLVSNNAGNSSNVVVADNDINGFANGVFLYENADEIKDVSVTGNDVANVADVGITALDASGSDGFSDVNGATTAANQADALLADNDVGVVTVDSETVAADTVVVDNDAPSDYASIQDAVNAVPSGTTVVIEGGTYDESFDVNTNNVSLVSFAGPDETTLNIGSERINVNADNVTVYGVSVVFENQGIYTGNDNVSIQNSTFELADGAETTGYGIRFEGGSSDGVVYNSEFVGINNSIEGEFGNGIVVSGPDNHLIINNTFTNNSIGVNVGSKKPAKWLYIANNTFTEQGTAAIALNHDPSENTWFDITRNHIESNDVGILALSGGSINIDQNDIVDNGVAVQSTATDTVDATRNWWGSESGPAADAVEGDVRTNPYLTVPHSEAADTRENLTEFGFTVEMDAGAHAFGVPGPVEGTVGSIFNEFNGTVYAYADGSWSQVTDSDRKLSALDALLVVPEEGETARASIEIAEGSDTAAPSSKELSEGWNFVGAPQAGGIETAYGASSADPARALNLYDDPTIGDTSPESDWIKYTFGTQSNGPAVSPVSGYWVYAEEDGSVAANVPAGVTYEEFTQLTAPSDALILSE